MSLAGHRDCTLELCLIMANNRAMKEAQKRSTGGSQSLQAKCRHVFITAHLNFIYHFIFHCALIIILVIYLYTCKIHNLHLQISAPRYICPPAA